MMSAKALSKDKTEVEQKNQHNRRNINLESTLVLVDF